MIGSFNNIKIQGICSAVPSYVEENEKYASTIGGSRVKKQIKITGVKKDMYQENIKDHPIFVMQLQNA